MVELWVIVVDSSDIFTSTVKKNNEICKKKMKHFVSNLLNSLYLNQELSIGDVWREFIYLCLRCSAVYMVEFKCVTLKTFLKNWLFIFRTRSHLNISQVILGKNHVSTWFIETVFILKDFISLSFITKLWINDWT